MSVLDSLWEVVDKCKDATGCAELTGMQPSQKYLVVWDPQTGTTTRAHRLILKRKLGREIRKGFDACHKCDNSRCVNENHIYEGTRSQNMLDATANGRGQAKKTHCPQGHEYSEDNTILYEGRRYCRACRDARNSARKGKG